MTEKQQNTLDAALTRIPERDRTLYHNIAEYAISLGYMPKLGGKDGSYAEFIKHKIKRTLIKLQFAPGAGRKYALKLSFYATDKYSPLFDEAVSDMINTLRRQNHEVRCWKCGMCDGTLGYMHIDNDGSRSFLCGKGVLQLPEIGAEHLDEIKLLMKAQDDFWMKERL
jgi:hypothetical protein